ncbi:MAG TPA: SDR family NAD(P)-dependent oxidoreductase [Myxococcota bacterium]|nr:SDR family NAD(P)-dependent oxidoreductase [Myxococcota bacterium]
MTEHRTAAEIVAGLDLRGKLCLVTGVSSGLGAETARVLAGAGAAVVGTARDVAKARAAVGDAGVEVGELELDSLASVRRFARWFDASHSALHALVNNAGVMACPLGRTQDGFERQFGTNHLGHFLLTGLLVPKLLAGAPARVVCVSSRGHLLAGVDLDDPNYERSPYSPWEAYGRAKSANVLFALELDRRLAARGVRANALHPGGIRTELGRHLTPESIQEMMARFELRGGPIQFKDVAHGAATQVWAAVSPELDGIGGRYLEDVRIGVPVRGETDSSGYAAHALDPDIARRLWTLSEKLVGERFDF